MSGAERGGPLGGHSLLATQLTDTLPDKTLIASQLGMSERTLQRRPGDIGFAGGGQLAEMGGEQVVQIRREIDPKTVLGRGKIECALYFRRAFDEATELQIDTDLVELIGHRISDLTAKLPNVAAVNPIDILRLPGGVQQGHRHAVLLQAAGQGPAEALLLLADDVEGIR